MKVDLYNGVAVLIISQQLECEVPYETVGKVLAHDGWVDVIQTIRKVYPEAFRAMCAHHHAEIQHGLSLGVPSQEVIQ